MIFFYLTPILLALNIFFIVEIHKWLDAMGVLPFNVRKAIKIVVSILWAVSFLAIYIAFLMPNDLDMHQTPFLYQLRRGLKQIGNYHLGVTIYWGMSFALILVSRGIEMIILWKKGLGRDEINDCIHNKRRAILGIINIAFVVGITLYGTYCAQDIKVNNYNIEVKKPGGGNDELRIVMVADLHMGYNIGCDQINKMVSMINEEEPDLVVVAGDIFDNEFEALEDPDELARALSSIKSRYGTYAVLGNHDVSERIIGGFTFNWDDPIKGTSDSMDEFLSACGWKLLMDEGVLVDDSIYIYGRPDYEKPGKDIVTRKSPEEIREILVSEVGGATIDHNELCKPVLVIDHEPRELQELADIGVDIDLCGHTHDGQFFPMNLTSRYLTWENSAGLLKKGNMYNIVTSGVGLFGPNIRIGTQAEICCIDVKFVG